MIIKHLLLIIAALLVGTWSIGFIGYGTGGIVHLLLVGAGLVIVLSLISDKEEISASDM